MLTQIVAILVLRTDSVGGASSKPAAPLVALSIAGAVVACALVFSPIGAVIDFAVPPLAWVGWLVAILAGYALCVRFVRDHYARSTATVPL